MSIPAYSSELDRYMSSQESDQPARYASAITPSDTVAPAIGPAGVYPKALYRFLKGKGGLTLDSAMQIAHRTGLPMDDLYERKVEAPL